MNPLVVVEKANGDIRICLDMRHANQAIIREKHSVPTVEETIQEVSYAKVFFKLDLNMAFQQIELHPDSRDITTFAAPDGLYRYKSLPFGVNMRRTRGSRTRGAKQSDIVEGDKVLLKQIRENKLSPNYEPEPYIATGKDGNAVTLQDTNGNNKMRKFH